MKDNPTILDGCSPDLVIDLSGRQLKRFNYPLNPTPSGATSSVESVKSGKGKLSGVCKLHSGLPSKAGIIESEFTSTSKDEMDTVKNTVIKCKSV